MSAGELFDLVRPIVLLASALASTWVLASARKQFQFYLALLWAGATFFLPLVVLPMYIVVAIYRRRPKVDSPKARFTLPVLYLLLILSGILAYEYVNDRSVDAHLARASFAKTSSDPNSAIQEYRAALELEDNPHTHKLLGLALMEAGYTLEAITEFRSAELQGEPDDTIHYYLGILLERVNMKWQSLEEFKKFAVSETCLQTDPRCEVARQRVAAGVGE
jgi:tetratricopeptide (TPR) repeat protein